MKLNSVIVLLKQMKMIHLSPCEMADFRLHFVHWEKVFVSFFFFFVSDV